LAATENAKVCTSVRSKYFTVETTSPEEGWSTPGRKLAAGEAGAEDGDGKGSGTVRLPHLIKELRSVACPARQPRTPARCRLGGWLMGRRQRESAGLPNFLLLENVSINIICGSLVSYQQDVQQFRVDVSCPEVQTRAIVTGSGALRRSFLKRRGTQEPFMFARGPQPTNL
jgi:hypothetical protein